MSPYADADLLTTGQFAALSGLSRKALRLYSARGLLCPVHVHAVNSYHYYSRAQLHEAADIGRLRALGMSLERIRLLLKADASERKELLAAHLADLKAQVRELQRAQEATEAYLQHGDVYRYHVALRPVGEQPYLGLRAHCPPKDLCALFTEARSVLPGQLQAHGALPAGPITLLYHRALPEEDRWEVECCLPVEVDATFRAPRDFVQHVLPPGPALSTLHSGPLRGHPSLDDAHVALERWAHRRSLEAAGPVREVYLFHARNRDDPADYRTEVVWPVRASGE